MDTGLIVGSRAWGVSAAMSLSPEESERRAPRLGKNLDSEQPEGFLRVGF